MITFDFKHYIDQTLFALVVIIMQTKTSKFGLSVLSFICLIPKLTPCHNVQYLQQCHKYYLYMVAPK